MQLARATILIAFAAALAACGGKDNNQGADAAVPTPDAPEADAPSRVCGSITGGTLELADADAEFIAWRGPATGDIAPTTNEVIYQYEFYSGIEASLAGTFDLTAGNQNNYATCAVCVRALEFDAQGELVRQFFQSAGSITITQDPITSQHLIADVTGLQLQEVTIDSMTYTSTPVADGVCGNFPASFSIDRDHVPSAWTCMKAEYQDGTNCNCMCGVSDPDCSIANAPVAGCAMAGDVCVADACVTPPANDTCASATPLTLATPVNGTTTGAGASYNTGLEVATCTGYPQAGPDVVYSLALTASQEITVTLSNLAANYDGSVALVGPGLPAVCDASPIGCLAGADAALEGANETFTHTVTDAGTYYIIVDGYGANHGTFTLTVTSP
jgi:hypothetical protein